MIPYPRVDPVFFSIGPLAFRWYGLMYALAFLFATAFTSRAAKRGGVRLTAEQVSDLVFHAAIGVILGGRLGYALIYNPGYYLHHPLGILAVWEGGMSFHGGCVGGLVAGWIFCRRRALAFYAVADVSMVSVPVGLGLGRLGNFINGELVGRATDVPWCMIFPDAGPECRHPSQLYQAGLEGVALFLILRYLYGKALARGVTFWAFFVFYGLFRFLVEFFRQPDAHIGFVLGPFSMGQMLSLPMCVLGLVMALRCHNAGGRPHVARASSAGRPERRAPSG